MAGQGAAEVWHGGELATARRLFPEAPEPWIDLSTGINPIPYPLPALPLSLWQRLPGAQDEARLLRAARRAYRVADDADIVAAPGTQILIELLPRLLGPGPVAVLGPTYAEHAQAWRKAGADLREIDDLSRIRDARIVVIVNPNNPDGRVVRHDRLHELGGVLAARGGLLVLDEAFVDFTPEASFVPEMPANCLVLRSFGKTYGLAGVRLGFLIAGPALASGFRAALGPWAVAGPALRIGALALEDSGWLTEHGALRARDAARLDALLIPHGELGGGTSLFRLLRSQGAPALFDRLGRAGIYVRRFQHDPELLRFGLPEGEPEWQRLEQALRPSAP